MSELTGGLVTVADLYRELVGVRSDIREAMVRLEAVETRDTNSSAALTDHETRIRLLERFRYTLAGVSAIGGLVAGSVGAWIGHLIK